MEGGGSADTSLHLQPCMQLVYILLAGVLEWQCVEVYGWTAYFSYSPVHFTS